MDISLLYESLLLHSSILITDISYKPTAAPFDLRWDSSTSKSGVSKLRFLVETPEDERKATLHQLIQDCQPASFGYKGEDVLDETYRKATKLDRSAFSTDFCPYELGIVDTIAQVLLPNAGGAAGTHGVKAELYKLNASLPTSYMFCAVDTITYIMHRSTLRHPASSKPTLIPHAPTPNSAPLLSPSHATTKAVSSSFVTLEMRLPSIGELLVRVGKLHHPFNGLPSTVTASTRFWKSLKAIASP